MSRRGAMAVSVILAAAMAAPSLCAGGEAPPALSKGQRVRVTWRDPAVRALAGQVVDVDGESIGLMSSDPARPGLVRVSLYEVERLEALRRVRTRAAEGAVIGGASLGLLAGGYGAFASSVGCPGTCHSGIGETALFFGIGAASGALVGGVIGSAFPVHRWQEVASARPRPTLSLAPERHGLRLALSVRF